MKPALSVFFAVCAAILASAASIAHAQTRYAVSGDGQEVTDAKTRLIWRRCPEGMTAGSSCAGSASGFTHEAALQRAATQAVSTGLAWRLPNVKELSSIADKSRKGPAIDPMAFPATPSAWFWSSSPNVFNPSQAWGVFFSDGVVGYERRSNTYLVRLVRAGQ